MVNFGKPYKTNQSDSYSHLSHRSHLSHAPTHPVSVRDASPPTIEQACFQRPALVYQRGRYGAAVAKVRSTCHLWSNISFAPAVLKWPEILPFDT